MRELASPVIDRVKNKLTYPATDGGQKKCDRVRGNRAYVGEIDIEIQTKTVGTISFVKVAFICLKFRVGIIESCQEV